MAENEEHVGGDAQPTKRECPACGHDSFEVEQYPADTASVFCSDCGNRCLLADLRESSVDGRWFDGE